MDEFLTSSQENKLITYDSRYGARTPGPTRMLDLYSGLGGASEYFRQVGCEVYRLENNLLLSNPESPDYVPGTCHQDILDWNYEEDFPPEYFDFIWASPPCVEFSNAYGAPRPTARREGREFQPDLSLVERAMEIICYFDPPWWVIENVSGASKDFSRVLGMPPQQIVGPFYFWGHFPRIQEYNHTKGEVDVWSSNPLRANIKAKIPIEISKAFYYGITQQRKITEW